MAKISTMRPAARAFDGYKAKVVRPVVEGEASFDNKADQVICDVGGEEVQFYGDEVVNLSEADEKALEPKAKADDAPNPDEHMDAKAGAKPWEAEGEDAPRDSDGDLLPRRNPVPAAMDPDRVAASGAQGRAGGPVKGEVQDRAGLKQTVGETGPQGEITGR